MNTKRPSQNPSADLNDPTQRFRNGFREALAEYENETRRRRSSANRTSPNPSADLNGPTDRFMARLQTLIAEHENEMRRQYLMRATRLKARNGHAIRRLPTGYGAERSRRWRKVHSTRVRNTIKASPKAPGSA